MMAPTQVNTTLLKTFLPGAGAGTGDVTFREVELLTISFNSSNIGEVLPRGGSSQAMSGAPRERKEKCINLINVVGDIGYTQSRGTTIASSYPSVVSLELSAIVRFQPSYLWEFQQDSEELVVVVVVVDDEL
ncbi:hypothetical protein Tco_0213552 [Tanacetum coccineum]